MNPRRVPRLETIAALSGDCTLVVRTYIIKRTDIDNLKKEALKKFGVIDVRVNNAERGRRGLLTVMPLCSDAQL
ncbi:MAG: hypothetical protein M1381_07895 [Deltaproteobacteria bacterium]|nr:hypothetical protein [Deltaproteobacteria bacterium]MCL5791452.1 hypothetical protein [Deltaproteobacteria bacterium]